MLSVLVSGKGKSFVGTALFLALHLFCASFHIFIFLLCSLSVILLIIKSLTIIMYIFIYGLLKYLVCEVYVNNFMCSLSFTGPWHVVKTVSLPGQVVELHPDHGMSNHCVPTRCVKLHPNQDCKTAAPPGHVKLRPNQDCKTVSQPGHVE